MTPHECRPPEGTPDGTVCWLKNRNLELKWVWNVAGSGWPEHWSSPRTRLASRCAVMYDGGWRFHSIAEPPHE